MCVGLNIFCKCKSLFQGYFPRGNFPNVLLPKRRLLKSILVAVLCPYPVLAKVLSPYCSLRLNWKLLLGKLPLEKSFCEST